MMKTLVAIAAVSFALSSSACGGIHDFPMSDSLAAIDLQLTVIETSLGSHADLINGAIDMGGVTDGEHNHDADMTVAHDNMMHEMDDMSGCHRDGDAVDAAALRTAVTELGVEFDEHAASMATAVDVDAAKTEELRHQSAIADLITSVRAARDAMSSGAGDYMCDGHGH